MELDRSADPPPAIWVSTTKSSVNKWVSMRDTSEKSLLDRQHNSSGIQWWRLVPVATCNANCNPVIWVNLEASFAEDDSNNYITLITASVGRKIQTDDCSKSRIIHSENDNLCIFSLLRECTTSDPQGSMTTTAPPLWRHCARSQNKSSRVNIKIFLPKCPPFRKWKPLFCLQVVPVSYSATFWMTRDTFSPKTPTTTWPFGTSWR